MRSLRDWIRLGIALLASFLAPMLRAGAPAVRPDARLATQAQSALSAGLREEYFVLELAPDPGAGVDPLTLSPRELTPEGALTELVGFAVLRGSGAGEGRQVELDLRFLERGTRVLQVERGDAGRTGMTWRELRATDGRTLHVEREAGAAAVSLREWSGPRLVRSEIPAAPGACLPLELLERIRAGGIEAGALSVLDPLSRGFESLDLRLERLPRPDSAPGAELRRAELVREDGTSAGRYLFEGTELLAFQWQEGGLRARRVEREDYLRRWTNLGAAPGAE